ncbi:MAG: hypothetical protein R3F19_34720 [Verrucomicrobiales bacterium]
MGSLNETRAQSAVVQESKLAAVYTSQAVEVPDATGAKSGIIDNNKDGWDDFWVSTYYGRSRKFDAEDKRTDSDHDGVSDYDEMRRFSDPFKQEKLRSLTPDSASDRRIEAVKRAVEPIDEGAPLTLKEAFRLSEEKADARAIQMAKEWIENTGVP